MATLCDGVQAPRANGMLSPDILVVGDAKYYTMVRGERLHPAMFATITEHVWLLDKSEVATKFLVFGNQREIPV